MSCIVVLQNAAIFLLQERHEAEIKRLNERLQEASFALGKKVFM